MNEKNKKYLIKSLLNYPNKTHKLYQQMKLEDIFIYYHITIIKDFRLKKLKFNKNKSFNVPYIIHTFILCN